jgi:hypothetical protein
VKIPDSVKFIREEVFSETKLSKLSLGSGLCEIGDGAFSGCQNLVNLKLPNSELNLQFLDSRIFSNCHNLEKIIVPDKVQMINLYMFENCNKLKTFIMGTGLRYIRLGAFDGCSSLEKGYFLGQPPIPYGAESLQYAGFYNCPNIQFYVNKNNSEWNSVNLEKISNIPNQLPIKLPILYYNKINKPGLQILKIPNISFKTISFKKQNAGNGKITLKKKPI